MWPEGIIMVHVLFFPRSTVFVSKVKFGGRVGVLHWAINRKFQPQSVGVADG